MTDQLLSNAGAATAVFSIVAATALGCGDDAVSAGRGGSGGSVVAGGAGAGQGGMSPGGAGGNAAVLDAGPDGAASSQGGSSQLPADCPMPAPLPVAGQTIAIQSVHFARSEIVLRNVSASDQTIPVHRQGWQWCVYPMYWSLEGGDTEVVLAPGETYAFVAINNQSGPVSLYADEGELAMYDRPGVFEEYELMQAFVAWGEIQAIRESYAVQKGLWTFGERVDIRAGHAGFIATGRTDTAAGYTSVRAACLVAPPNP